MASHVTAVAPGDIEADKSPAQVLETKEPVETATSVDDTDSRSTTVPVPLTWKLMSIVLVTCIGFGSQWSSGITGAMKSTIKKEMNINNKQFSILEASEDFMVTALMLVSGIVTDRIGGAGAMLYGNIIYSIGSILVAGAAQTRSYQFMIAGRVIRALGDIATQVAQYKVFSSWFAPNNGFASTLGFELGMGKIGAFAGKSSANIIAKRTGDFAWVFWVAVFMNLFTNVMTGVFYWFTKVANSRFHGIDDPATGEKLTEKSKKFELRKILELPWSYWAVMAFSLFETSTAIVFLQNATELAEQRFGTSSITAGWYSATLQYAGFFVVPLLGIFLDLFGNRITICRYSLIADSIQCTDKAQWLSAVLECSRPCSSLPSGAPSKARQPLSASLPLRTASARLPSLTASGRRCGITPFLDLPTPSRSP